MTPRWRSPLKKVFSAWYNSDPQAVCLVLRETIWCWPVTVICLPICSSCTLVNITCQKMILFWFFLNRRKERIKMWGNSVYQQKWCCNSWQHLLWLGLKPCMDTLSAGPEQWLSSLTPFSPWWICLPTWLVFPLYHFLLTFFGIRVYSVLHQDWASPVQCLFHTAVGKFCLMLPSILHCKSQEHYFLAWSWTPKNRAFHRPVKK